jgi:hypothetical protein
MNDDEVVVLPTGNGGMNSDEWELWIIIQSVIELLTPKQLLQMLLCTWSVSDWILNRTERTQRYLRISISCRRYKWVMEKSNKNWQIFWCHKKSLVSSFGDYLQKICIKCALLVMFQFSLSPRLKSHQVHNGNPFTSHWFQFQMQMLFVGDVRALIHFIFESTLLSRLSVLKFF